MLPFVLIAISAVSIIAFAFTAEGLQGMRGQRGAEEGDAVANAADAAMVQALDAFADDSLWRWPLGPPYHRTVTVNGITVAVQWQRHQPMVATLRAFGRTTTLRRIDAAARERYRAVWLAPPPLPVVAALASSRTVSGRQGTIVSGSDAALPDSPCGLARDTASVSGVSAPAVEEDVPGGWPEAPRPVPVDTGFLSHVRAALAVIDRRLPATSARRSPDLFPLAPDWTALHLRGDTVTIAGPARWTGLLVIRGHLVLTGRVHVTGVLLVEGPLTASAAQLSVQGAVLAADTSARGVTLGAHSRLTYDRCAVEMALAAVARPTLAPFSLWENLAPQAR